MRLKLQPQTIKEWVAIKANLAPVPLMHTLIFAIISRAVLCAYKYALFDAVEEDGTTIEGLSEKTGLNKKALTALMNVLLAADYFTFNDGYYKLHNDMKKWTLQKSANSLHNQQLFNFICWDMVEHMDEFLKTGKGLQYHDTFGEEEWELYQKGMADVAKNSVKEAVKMLPKLSNPESMLDIGGAHGLACVALCKKYNTLNATILDLPGAVDKAAPLLAARGMGARVKHKAGNILTDEIGANEYDIILASSLIHHFNESQCNLLAQKAAKALKQGGYFIIQDFLRPEPSKKMEMVGSIMNLFFNVTSTSGTWSLQEIRGFYETAGLKFKKVNNFLAPPGFVQVIGIKE